jgi:hypothetical protein
LFSVFVKNFVNGEKLYFPPGEGTGPSTVVAAESRAAVTWGLVFLGMAGCYQSARIFQALGKARENFPRFGKTTAD